MSGSGQIAVGMMVMNIGTYGFSVLAARVIGPVEYGAFFALMNLILIISVAQLGLQATAARRISADPEHVGQIEQQILRVTSRTALGLGVLLLLAAPLINWALDLGSIWTAVVAALAAIPMTMMGAQAGILQGERRWRQLAIFYMMVGVPRVLVGVALILWRPTELTAMIAVLISFVAPWLYGRRVLRADRSTGATHERHAISAIMREAMVNSQALFAFFALTNVDMIIGRTVLNAHDSGLYAAGLIVARAVLFLPQFVVVIAFPSMSTASSRTSALRKSLLLVGGLGGASTLITALLPDLALVFVGGPRYAEVRHELWIFALLGTVMAMLQLLVYSVLARQGKLSVYLVWVALVALVAGAYTVSTVAGLLTVVITVEATLLLVLLAITWLMLRREPALLVVEPAQ